MKFRLFLSIDFDSELDYCAFHTCPQNLLEFSQADNIILQSEQNKKCSSFASIFFTLVEKGHLQSCHRTQTVD